ncbi:hypothetical protein N0V93_002170 [Gnomoniopsis smithogilvyi]|uniref:FAD-binding domain-containing protein n=1 Tax=Gnomoniopsis smithogilvyi TaxID=1191159 RepID=A0A9W9CXW7_9PEZI|nr:hypothetical protein N0V93_002170 [Gnomoniopsis smithogilvyi]
MPLKILILGAGVAGPALAAMLLSNPTSARSYHIKIVERSPSLRRGGQQIDIRAQGIPVVKRLGLLEKVKERCVNEKGMALLNTRGKMKAFLGTNDTGSGPQGLSSEYEIIRGDLVDVLYRESLAKAESVDGKVLEYKFGKFATEIAQHGDHVRVDFSDGSSGEFDLVVGADGYSSRTRRMVFGAEVSSAAFHSLGVYNALFDAPINPAEEDVFVGKICHFPDKRIIATRTNNKPYTQVFLTTMAPTPKLVEAVPKGVQAVEEQKAAWEECFRDLGWRSNEILDAMKTSDDFYTHVSGQVKLDSWHRGRVVLLGDAGYCPSPNTGMGTTTALVGCYVLAGELMRHGKDVDTALELYERVLRPFVDEAQTLPPGLPRMLYYDTNWGIWIFHFILGLFTWLKVDKLLYRMIPEQNGDWKLPNYPELDLRG